VANYPCKDTTFLAKKDAKRQKNIAHIQKRRHYNAITESL